MSNYIGYECIVCGQKINNDDDIVVCPDCGTPYHRECYIKSGECINEELHKSGGSWKKSVECENVKSEYKKCLYCETVNKPHSIICEQCGAPLVDDLNKNMSYERNQQFGGMNNSAQNSQKFGNSFAFDPQDKCCGIDPEEDFDSIKLGDLAKFVKTNQLYYLPIFKKIKDTGKKASLNIASFFFPQLYFANRKMWFWCIVSIIVSSILSIPYMISMVETMGTLGNSFNIVRIIKENFDIINEVSNILNLIFQAMMLLFSNWLYYRHSINKIKDKKTVQGQNNAENLAMLGGTSTAGAFISFLAQMALTGSVLFLLTK